MAIGKRDRDRLGAGTPQGSRGAHFRPVGSADACGCAGEPTLGARRCVAAAGVPSSAP